MILRSYNHYVKSIPLNHHRQSIRLPDYDYSQTGAYFITLCVQQKVPLFGSVSDGKVDLNEFGKCVDFTWSDLPKHISSILLDEYVIMPNHFHGIVFITETSDSTKSTVGAGPRPAPNAVSLELDPREAKNIPPAEMGYKSTATRLSEIVRQFKAFSAQRINKLRSTPGQPVWQRNYYEHIVRDEEDLNRIREYILENPSRWGKDGYEIENIT